MFERFTDKARRVTVLAQEECRLLKHNAITVEHMLLGLLKEEEGIAAIVLTEKGITYENTRKNIETVFGIGNVKVDGYLAFTPECKKALELSLREALQLGHNYISTEHILLGLLRGNELSVDVVEVPFLEIRTAIVKHLSKASDVPLKIPEDPIAKKLHETIDTANENIEPVLNIDLALIAEVVRLYHEGRVSSGKALRTIKKLANETYT